MRRKLLLTLLSVVTLISSTNGLPTPQLRSVQLGGTGPRPVLLGSHQQSPAFSQQLTFGGPPQLQQQQQFPTQQQQQLLSQNPGLRFSTPTPSTRPILLQQGRPSPTQAGASSPFSQPGQPPIGSFPIPPTFRGGSGQQQGQQQLVYRARQPVIAVSPTSATDDDEYDDEEYDEPQVPTAVRQAVPVQTTARPIVQRVPARQFLQAQTPTLQTQQPTPARFAIPQQVQPAQVQRSRQRVQAQQVVAQPTPTAVYASQPQLQHQGRLGQDSRLGSDRQTTVPPIQTLNRFMRQNDDGSITWGYENEDGSFKEETLGADCVVRGKYGYVDPDGVKREYEYQSGNPCDPNKRGQEEEEEDELDDVVGQQRLAGILSARPIQLQQRQRQ